MYDATTAGAVGASVNSSITDGNFCFSSFTVAGGSYLQAVNGVDELQMYDGSSWATINAVSSPAITGLATDSISNIHIFKRRIWYVEKDSTSAWYLPVDVVAGALTEFPLGELFGSGGYLVAIGSWTIDGGTGLDDYIIFISSEGEALVYKGIDPASDFTLVGVYLVGAPLGKRCFAKYGGEVFLLTHYGLLPLSKVLRGQDVQDRIAKSDKISPTFTSSAASYGSFNGWGATIFAPEDMLLINVPTEEGVSARQLAMNLLTGAWCLFSQWNAFCWAVFDKKLFYGGNGAVVQAYTGDDDFGADIVAKSKQAFNYFGSFAIKDFKLVQPILRVTNPIALSLGLNIDFDDLEVASPTSASPLEASLWDTGVWDSAIWGSDSYTLGEWESIPADPGVAASLLVYSASQGVSVHWDSTNFIFQEGNGL